MTVAPAIAGALEPGLPGRRHWLWLVGGLALLLLFALGSRGLNEPDEGRYANIARAMVLSGDWWEPRMSGLAHYDKPPLVYWTTALAFQVFGFNEWAARLPSLLGAVCTLLGLGWAAFRLYGARVAWWSVLICGTTAHLLVFARILTPDMALTGWCTLAVATWAETRARAGAWGPWLLSVLFWSLAWWTKATPALIPLLGLAIGIGATRDRAGWRALRLWFLFPLVVGLGSIWYVSMLRHYPELKEFFFGRELAGRMTGHVHGRRGSPFYYLVISAVAWLPWWPLAAKAAWDLRRRLWPAGSERWRESAARLGPEGWILVTGLLVFSLAASKLPTYTLPLLPWAALLFARLLCARFDPAVQPWPRLPLAIACGFGGLALAGTLVVPRFESRLGVNSSVREVARLSQAAGPRRVYTDRYWPGMEFYLDENRVRYLVNPDRIRQRDDDAGRPPGMFIAPSGDGWRDSPAAERAPLPNGAEVWLLRFRKQTNSPFAAWARPAEGLGATRRVGQFTLIPARIEGGRIVPTGPESR